MKKSIGIFGIFVLLLSVATLMSSCKKTSSKLSGTWSVVTATINGDREDDLDDIWSFRPDGSCTIECDFEEYFDFPFHLDPNQEMVKFPGNYTVYGDKKLTIDSEKFNTAGSDYDRIVYELEITSLDKHNLAVEGTVRYTQSVQGAVNSQTSKISLTLAK